MEVRGAEENDRKRKRSKRRGEREEGKGRRKKARGRMRGRKGSRREEDESSERKAAIKGKEGETLRGSKSGREEG